MEGALLQAFVFLIAAVIAVPIASRLGLGSVLGYLIAGIIIGPVLGLLGGGGHGHGEEGMSVTDIQHFAEFGVVMMLFLVGLELEPKQLWHMRAKLLGLGGLQVGLTTVAVAGIAYLLGQPTTIAIAIGLVFALSSTAIVLQTLGEKGLMKSDGGQSSFSVLLFQDIAVIPMLALIPLLAIPELAAHLHGDDHGHGASLSIVDGLSGWARAAVTLGAIAGVVALGIFITPYFFRIIAQTGLREMFTAGALALVIGIAVLMTVVGLSPALGTFLAGVVLANSEYRHELESDIEPFKGLLLGLFFITVGAGIDFGFLGENLAPILALTLGLMLLKAAILLILSLIFSVTGSDRWLFALGLAQAGEFGFVLLSFSVSNAVIPAETAEFLLMMVALSMLLTPALFILFERVILPKFTRDQETEADEITEQGVALILGLGRFGQISNRMLLGNGYRTVVIDSKASLIENFKKLGVRSFYGDASRPDLLHAAGLHEARVAVVAIDDPERALDIVHTIKRDAPHVHVVARARERTDVYKLYQAGADDIIRETFDSAMRAARCALEALGEHPFEAEKIVDAFRREDRKTIRELAGLWDPDTPVWENEPYLAKGREMARELEEVMQGLREPLSAQTARSWMPPGHYGDTGKGEDQNGR